MSLSSSASLSFRAIFLALIIPLLRLLFSIVSFFLKRFFALAALLGTIIGKDACAEKLQTHLIKVYSRFDNL